MSFVRASKFRHVFGTAAKADACFTGLKTEGTGDTNCAVSCKFFAMIKASKIFVVPLDKTGRQEENNMFYLDCKAKSLDVAWSPFNDCVLASCEESGDVNVWNIPEDGLTATMTEPFWKLHDIHTKKVTFLSWHPTASDILASGGADTFIVIWDCESQQVINKITVGEMPTSLAWNDDGSRVAITTKENRVMSLSIVDPLTGEEIHKNPKCHEGTKPTKCIILSNGNIITLGADRQANKSILLWDKDHINDDPLFEVDIGNSSAVLNIYYDPDLSLLYTCIKGECVIKYYELDDQDQIHYLSTYQSTTSQKGGNFLPKRGVKFQQNEIARFYKLQANKCEPISFTVPRKSDHFQDDIYPPCYAGEASMTGAEWIAGKKSDPIKMDFRDLLDGSSSGGQARKQVKPMVKKSLPKREVQSGLGGGGEQPSPAIQYRHSSSNNGIPEGIDFAELLEDMKKVKATVRKLNKRVSKLEEQLEQEREMNQEREEEEEE